MAEQLDLIRLMPALETARLVIRPFRLDDLDTIHAILDADLGGGLSLDERRTWLQWTVLNYRELARLYQEPLGDRAVVLKADGRLIGACGYSACSMPFGQLPYFQREDDGRASLHRVEIGLYYAFSSAFRGQGYATEAAEALVEHAFTELNLRRIVATTTYDNVASQRVMQRLGMTIETNPFPEPAWFQVVGILENRLTRF